QPRTTGLLDISALGLYLLLLPAGLAFAEAALTGASAVIQSLAPDGEIRPDQPLFIWRWVALVPFLLAMILIRNEYFSNGLDCMGGNQ
ncbi:MAG: hypothetical protein Q8O63_05365, partial [Hoeflea sp.]|nr:hypothetical protein [Hoeflea sp.]